jgi:hypothetical protein
LICGRLLDWLKLKNAAATKLVANPDR